MNDDQSLIARELRLDELVLVDEVCCEFESGWKRGEPTRLEEYLWRVEEHCRPTLVYELLLVEFNAVLELSVVIEHLGFSEHLVNHGGLFAVTHD